MNAVGGLVSNTCFYCGLPMVLNWQRGKRTRTPHNAWTDDHVFPRNGKDHGKERSVTWRRLNKVPCCHACNQQKALLHPLDWLVIVPSNSGAARLKMRLLDLGVSEAEVTAAMRRRK